MERYSNKVQYVEKCTAAETMLHHFHIIIIFMWVLHDTVSLWSSASQTAR